MPEWVPMAVGGALLAAALVLVAAALRIVTEVRWVAKLVIESLLHAQQPDRLRQTLARINPERGATPPVRQFDSTRTRGR